VTVLARRGDLRIPWRRAIEFFVDYDSAPSQVIATVEASLARAEFPNVAHDPRAVCTCRAFDDNSIRYAVLYWLNDPALDQVTDSQVRAHVFAALSRHHLEMPLVRRVLLTPDAVSAQNEATSTRELTRRLEVLSRLKLFDELTEGERRALAAELTDEPYVAGEVISREGEVSDSMYILASGSVEILREPQEEGAERQHLADQNAPNHFGEMGLLTGSPRLGTVIARETVLCYRLEKRGFDAILQARPEIAEALSQVVAARFAANDATLQALDEVARRKRASGTAGDLLRRIRVFFDLAQ